MNPSDFFNALDETRASTNPYLRVHYGQHVVPMTPERAAWEASHPATARAFDPPTEYVKKRKAKEKPVKVCEWCEQVIADPHTNQRYHPACKKAHHTHAVRMWRNENREWVRAYNAEWMSNRRREASA